MVPTYPEEVAGSTPSHHLTPVRWSSFKHVEGSTKASFEQQVKTKLLHFVALSGNNTIAISTAATGHQDDDVLHVNALAGNDEPPQSQTQPRLLTEEAAALPSPTHEVISPATSGFNGWRTQVPDCTALQTALDPRRGGRNRPLDGTSKKLQER